MLNLQQLEWDETMLLGDISRFEFNRETGLPLYTPLCVIKGQQLSLVDDTNKVWIDLTQGDFSRFFEEDKVAVLKPYYQNVEHLPEGYTRYI